MQMIKLLENKYSLIENYKEGFDLKATENTRSRVIF